MSYTIPDYQGDGNFDAKPTFAIRYPSSYVGGARGTEDIWIAPIERFSTTENIEQTTVNSISQSHIGFTTTYQDFTGTFTMYETAETMAVIDELIAKNLFFDIVIASIDEGAGVNWRVEESFLIGCKITRRERVFEYGRMPMRTYAFKYLEVEDVEERDGSFFNIPFGDGRFLVNIGDGAEVAASERDQPATADDLDTVSIPQPDPAT